MRLEYISSKLQQLFNENQYDGAELFLKEILERDPDQDLEGKISFQVGKIKFLQGSFAEAKKWFILTLKRDLDHFNARFLLARTLEMMGEENDALRLYADCIEIKPDVLPLSDFTNSILMEKNLKNKDLSFIIEHKRTLKRYPEYAKISIIILCYNNVNYTEKCLASIFKNTDYPDFEVIVVDNASVDDTTILLEIYSKRVKYTRSPTNLGFVGGNNMAAGQAEGEYIIFLNNDTEVTKGWLSELYRCFQMHPQVGAVGSMLIYPDGKLQEAGGIIFKDGSGWNYGKNQTTSASRFFFTREVDYCSGASLMIRKDLFVKVGKFDERFTPAYYEDTDLCFGIRKLGYKVLYCPTSIVVHHEGVTAGTDLNSGFKKYQGINTPKFRNKWKKELELQYSNDEKLIYQFSNRKKGKKVLIIDDLPPFPDRAAGSLRMYHTVKQMLHLGYQVTYVHLIGRNLDSAAQEHMKWLRLAGVELIWFDYESWWNIRNTPAVRPILQALIKGLDLPMRKFDFVYICFWHIAAYFLDLIRENDPNIPVLVDSMDLHYLRELRQAEVKGIPR